VRAQFDYAGRGKLVRLHFALGFALMPKGQIGARSSVRSTIAVPRSFAPALAKLGT
jgi:hypothetical protein